MQDVEAQVEERRQQARERPGEDGEPGRKNGSTPVDDRVAATAAPSGKLPSTVRSGKLRTRNDRNTPSATRPNTSPISTRPEGDDGS